MRDTIKTEAYFHDYISDLDRRLKRFSDKLIANEVREDRIEAVHSKMFSMSLDKIIAMYSAGYKLEEIKAKFEDLLQDVHIRNANNRYVEIIQLISLCILLECDPDLANNIIKVIDRDGVDDFLMSLLTKHLNQNRNLSNAVMHTNPYGKLYDVAALKSDSPIKEIQEYLSRFWYRGHSDMGWYNSHKEEGDIYSGYWSFESAALVKILELDDLDLKDKMYYPYDLVHFKI